jgi:hypothetical protein
VDFALLRQRHEAMNGGARHRRHRGDGLNGIARLQRVVKTCRHAPLGYSSTNAKADGAHQGGVKRPGIDVRARKG